MLPQRQKSAPLSADEKKAELDTDVSRLSQLQAGLKAAGDDATPAGDAGTSSDDA